MNKPRRVIRRKDENLAAIGTGGKFSFRGAGLENGLTKSSCQIRSDNRAIDDKIR
jgi:hypothetical protein